MNSTILVITGDAAWTRRAVHLAAAMARDAARDARRDAGGELWIVQLLPVTRLEDLGANAREELLGYDRYEALAEWAATAESYGVAARVELFEYTDYSGALLSAAEQIAPRAIFAPPPGGHPALVARAREKLLRRRLGRPWFTLDDGDGPMAWSEAPDEARPAPAAAREARV